MSLNTELITQLQKLTTLEPSLIQELKNVKSVETGAEAVMAQRAVMTLQWMRGNWRTCCKTSEPPRRRESSAIRTSKA